MTPIVYLHGFASSPSSTKSQFFCRRFAERNVPFEVPRLDRENFTAMTISSVLDLLDEVAGGKNVTLMGSSLGGYIASLYAARHSNVERLILMAPAFDFPSRWRHQFSPEEFEDWKRTGARNFFHYAFNEERPLGYQFVEDAIRYEDNPDFKQPALIVHGEHDDVVPVEVSERFAAHHPNAELKIVQSGHDLNDVLEFLWAETARFLGFQKP